MSHHTMSQHKCTIHGLQHWFEAKFEKLGWMALAKEHGNDLKVRSYLESISHLIQCLKDKIESVHDVDSKEDLKIMLEHTETLSKSAHTLLDSELGDCSKKQKYHSNINHDATFYGLHKWETKMFEHLGWMVLSHNEGNSLKIQVYMDSIHRLKEMLKNKMHDVREKDRKDDLKILYDDTCILWRSGAKLFGTAEIETKVKAKSKAKSYAIEKSKKYKHNVYAHSDDAPKGMEVKVDSKGKKHYRKISLHSMKKHHKERHVRKDKDAYKYKTKKHKAHKHQYSSYSSKSNSNSNSNLSQSSS